MSCVVYNSGGRILLRGNDVDSIVSAEAIMVAAGRDNAQVLKGPTDAEVGFSHHFSFGLFEK